MKKLQEHLDEGWSVQIYDGNRHLLFSLYPSHVWAFLAGLLLGFILALFGLGDRSATQSSPSISTPMEPPLRVD